MKAEVKGSRGSDLVSCSSTSLKVASGPGVRGIWPTHDTHDNQTPAFHLALWASNARGKIGCTPPTSLPRVPHKSSLSFALSHPGFHKSKGNVRPLLCSPQ